MLKTFGIFSVKQLLLIIISVLLILLLVVIVAGLSSIRDPQSRAASNERGPGLMTNDTYIGTVPWQNLSGTPNVTINRTNTPHILKASNFGFSIPSGNTITGISVSLTRIASLGQCASDSFIAVYKGGTRYGKNPQTFIPASSSTASFGGSTDTWGTTWSLSDINSNSFAVGYAPYSACIANTTVTVTQVRMTVHYQTSAPPPDTSAPSVPGNLHRTGTNTTNSVSLAWNASTDNVGVVGYQIYRDGNHVNTTTGTSVTIGGLSPNTTYSFSVRAYDAVPNYSGFSNSITETTAAGSDTSPPTAPGNLRLNGNTTTSSIPLIWNASSDNVGVVRYEVYRDNGRVNSGTGTSFTDTGLTAGTSYNYFVKAFDAAGNSSQSSTQTFSTQEAPVAAPPNEPPGFDGAPTLPGSGSSGGRSGGSSGGNVQPPTVAGVLNILTLKLSLPHLIGKTKLLFVIGGYSFELDARAAQTEYQIDVRAANFGIGKDLEITMGGQFLLIKKVKINPKGQTETVDLGELPMGDLNNDNRINSEDKTILLSSVGRSNGGDINNDGVTNSFDWAIYLKYNGKNGN